MKRFLQIFLGGLLGTLAAFSPALAQAPSSTQEWPQPGKTVRILVPIPPGGTADGMARAIANRLSQNIGVPVVVENKPGASTLVAANELRRSPPDGETILYTITTTTSQLPHFYKNLPFDVFTGFTPLGLIAYNSLVLVANPKEPFNTVSELVAYARAHPNKLNFGSFGTGSNPHIDGELMKKNEGLQMTHVAYRGSSDASRAVMAGEVDFLFDSPVTAINTIQSGVVKPLGIAGPKRIPAIPNVPTMTEAGIPGLETPGLEQLLGPPGMSKALQTKVNAALMKAVRSPEVIDLYVRGGFDIKTTTGEEHAVLMKESYERWGAVIRSLNIKLE
jgi:tripartite-type tricarboxylate transporter receptor subunit TctC